MQNDENHSPIQEFFHNKWIKIILCVDVLIVIVIIIISIYNNTKNAFITFDITPVDATISINSNSNYSNSTYRIQPGNYTITISHDNLDTKTFNLNLPDNSSTLLSTYLSANNGTDFSFYEQKNNYESASKLLSMAPKEYNYTYDYDYTAEKFATEYKTMLEIYDKALPIINNTHESSDYGGRIISTLNIQKNDSCSKYLCVSAKTSGLSNATDSINRALEESGFNLKYLEVQYETN